MSVTATVLPVLEARPYNEDPLTYLPPGVQPWFVSGAILCDGTGGGARFAIEFNPSQLREFQPYIVLCRVSVHTDTAGAVGGVEVVQSAGSWERTLTNVGGASSAVTVTQGLLVQEETSAKFGFAREPNVYLGRAMQGTIASLALNMQNVDTMNIVIHMTGFQSDHPFLATSERMN